jgi:hypothetical protein
MAKQLTFPRVMTCNHVYPDGREEKIRYGKYECIMIDSENGWPVYRTVILIAPNYLVTEVMKTDGTKVVFDEPWYLIEKSNYGDGSERTAPRWTMGNASVV